MAFIRQASLVASGVAGGQLIVLLATPWLARIYSPAEFGVYAVFVSISSILLVLACLRYEVAIPVVPDQDIDAVSQVAFVAAVITSLIVFLIASAEGVSRFLPLFSDLKIQAPWLALMTLFSGWVQIAVNRSIRSGKFALNAMIRIIQPAIFVLTAIMLQSFGLITAYVVGFFAAAVFGLITSMSIGMILHSSRSKALAVAKKNREYPIFSLPTAILDTTALVLPVLIIASFFGDADAGNYSQVQRLIAAPLLLSGIAIGQVFFKHSGEMFRSGEPVGGFMWRTVAVLATAGMVLIATAWLVGEPVLGFLLGSDWRTDTKFILLVLLPVIIRMCVSPVSSIFLTCNRIKLGMKWQVIYFLANIIVLPFAATHFDLDRFLIIFLINETWLYSLYLYLAHVVTQNARHADEVVA